METYYHYTTLSTLIKIVGGIKEDKLYLRAGNAKLMNDPNDCYYFINLLKQLNKIKEKDMDEIVKEKDKYDSPYIVSLSSHKDDLHMWTCYGDNGNGVAIGFEDLENAASEFFLNKHIYAKFYQCKYMDENDIKKDYRFSVINEAKNFGKEFWEKPEISQISNIIKHPCYRYEDESRIVIEHGEKEQAHGVDKTKDKAIFIGVPLSKVTKIVVGPCADYDAVKKVFSPFFENVDFVKSTIPYRSK